MMVKEQLFESEEEERYVHIYYSDGRVYGEKQKIKLAEAKVAKTRVVHEKAVDELKKLYDMQKKQQRNYFITKVFCNRSLYISFN